MRKITADWVYPIANAPIQNGVLTINDSGEILAIDVRSNHNMGDLEVYKGILVPGFVNTHCHLELSHMKGVAPTGTGLLPFLKTVVNHRNVSEKKIQEAIQKGDKEMREGGIVAVGDISNKTDTANAKDDSRIRYYTFVEMFDFMQEDWAENTFNDYWKVFEGQSDKNGNRKSPVPHAPYTVSRNLFHKLRTVQSSDATISIHNQETKHEDNFFLKKKGDFLEFDLDLELDLDLESLLCFHSRYSRYSSTSSFDLSRKMISPFESSVYDEPSPSS